MPMIAIVWSDGVTPPQIERALDIARERVSDMARAATAAQPAPAAQPATRSKRKPRAARPPKPAAKPAARPAPAPKRAYRRPAEVDTAMRSQGYIPLTEAASLACVAEKSIYGWVRAGDIVARGERHNNRTWRYISRASLDAHLAARQAKRQNTPQANA